MSYMTIGLKKEVSLVLLPIDDYTDRVITGSELWVYTTEERLSSIRKADGYHIFCDLPGNETEVCLEGPLYQKKILRFPIGQDRPSVFQVRMLPGVCYPLLKGTTIVKGVLPPESMIRLFFPGQRKKCKLLKNYDPLTKERELSLFLPYEMLLVGKTMCIGGKDRAWEFFRVADQKKNIATLEQPLSGVYQKTDAGVYPVYEASVSEDGNLYLPIGGLSGEVPCVCILLGKDGTEQVREFTLTAGKENRITKDLWEEED